MTRHEGQENLLKNKNLHCIATFHCIYLLSSVKQKHEFYGRFSTPPRPLPTVPTTRLQSKPRRQLQYGIIPVVVPYHRMCGVSFRCRLRQGFFYHRHPSTTTSHLSMPKRRTSEVENCQGSIGSSTRRSDHQYRVPRRSSMST